MANKIYQNPFSAYVIDFCGFSFSSGNGMEKMPEHPIIYRRIL